MAFTIGELVLRRVECLAGILELTYKELILMAVKLEALTAAVEKNTSLAEGTRTLIEGLVEKIAKLPSPDVDELTQKRVDALVDALSNANTVEEIAQALAVNTPSDPEAPPAEPATPPAPVDPEVLNADPSDPAVREAVNLNPSQVRRR